MNNRDVVCIDAKFVTCNGQIDIENKRIKSPYFELLRVREDDVELVYVVPGGQRVHDEVAALARRDLHQARYTCGNNTVSLNTDNEWILNLVLINQVLYYGWNGIMN